MSHVGTRPTEERLAVYQASWESSSKERPELESLLRAAAADTTLSEFLQTQYNAACYLDDVLVELGAPEGYRKDWCFKFGRLCFGRKPWEVFDKVVERCAAEMVDFQNRRKWVDLEVSQEVPEPSELLGQWFDYAKNSVGEEGVYPQPFLHGDAKGQTTMVAMAMDGNECFRHIIENFGRPDYDIQEAVFGIDMEAVEWQGTKYTDFLAVVWYIGGEFYTGVVNYQRSTVEDAAFEPIDWNNNFWSNSLRKYPLPELRDALRKRDAETVVAEGLGSPEFNDLPFEKLSSPEVAQLLRVMPPHLKGLVHSWGWGDTVLRDGMLEWLAKAIFDLEVDQYYAKDDQGEYKLGAFRDLMKDGTRIPLDLNKLSKGNSHG